MQGYPPPEQAYEYQQEPAQTSYTAAPTINAGPGADVVAAGGAAFAQKLAMANLAQHLAGSDPGKQQTAIAGVQVSWVVVLPLKQQGWSMCVHAGTLRQQQHTAEPPRGH